MNRVTRCACLVASSLSLAACNALFAADGPAATQPASQPAAAQATTAPSKVSINFKDAPLDTVIDFLSQSLGLAIVKDGVLDGRVTIVSKQPVTQAEAITLVNASLKANGYTAINEGRILASPRTTKPRKATFPFISAVNRRISPIPKSSSPRSFRFRTSARSSSR